MNLKNMIIELLYSLLYYFLIFGFIILLILIIALTVKILLKIKTDNNIIRVILNSIHELYANLIVLYFLKTDVNSFLNNQNVISQAFNTKNNNFKKKKINFSRIKFNFKEDELIFKFIPGDFIAIKFFEDEKNLIAIKSWINQRYNSFDFTSFFKENNNFVLIGRKKI